ncbi:MAG: protein BatD [Bacteroidia bacterium]|nr:protein BatD [Bacteroidia bacterium]
MNRFILLLTALVLLTAGLSAQDVKFTAQATNVVEVGEQFRLVFSVNAKGTDLKLPPLTDFNILSGPSSSSSTNMQVINGQVSQSSSYSYTYILQAIKTGKFTISPATITVNGKQYKTNSLTVEVVKATGGKAQTQNQNQNTQGNKGNAATNTNIPDVKGEDLFARITVNKNSMYQGENLVAIIKVYTKVNVISFENYKFPSFKGFFSQDIEAPTQYSFQQRENVNGQIYNVCLIKKVSLYPQKSGELTIEPFELECGVRQQVRSQNRNIWDDFFGTYQNVKKKIVSPQVKINVKPLPGNAPESFSGAVGKFNMTATINTKQVKTNDGINLKITVSGTGNLKLVDTLNIKLPSDFEKYDPKISNNFKNTAEGGSGSKVFEYLIIPRHAGNFTIPPIEFTYFDLGSKQYKTILSDDFKIKVEKGSEEENVSVVSGMTKEDVKYIGSDVRFLKKNPFTLHKKGELLFGSWKFILCYLLALGLFITLYILMRERIRQNANLALVKNKRANKISKRRLKVAAQYLRQNNKTQFYNETLKALWGYMGDKLSIPVADLSRDTAASHLEKHQVETDLISKVMALIENCEYAHFAPSSEAYQMDKIYTEASNIISDLENKLR